MTETSQALAVSCAVCKSEIRVGEEWVPSARRGGGLHARLCFPPPRPAPTAAEAPRRRTLSFFSRR